MYIFLPVCEKMLVLRAPLGINWAPLNKYKLLIINSNEELSQTRGDSWTDPISSSHVFLYGPVARCHGNTFVYACCHSRTAIGSVRAWHSLHTVHQSSEDIMPAVTQTHVLLLSWPCFKLNSLGSLKTTDGGKWDIRFSSLFWSVKRIHFSITVIIETLKYSRNECNWIQTDSKSQKFAFPRNEDMIALAQVPPYPPSAAERKRKRREKKCFLHIVIWTFI